MQKHVVTWFRKTFVPILLILFTPPMVILMWTVNVDLGGSLQRLWEQGIFTTLFKAWGPVFFGSSIAWKMIAAFSIVQLILMRLLPGKSFEGPITPTGHTPRYKENGILAFLSTLGLFYLGAYQLHLFSPTIIYDNFGALLGALNTFSLCFCLLLYVKGHVAPSTKDSGTTGHFIFDYFWGMELYPRFMGWDVKMFTNCRFGMMSWGLIIISFAAKQNELYGLSDAMLVSVALQLIYIAKFFLWEPGYMRSMDIMHDRAGYCICWGCLVWVPGIYTSPALFLVNHPHHLGLPLAGFIFVVGCSGIVINYLADLQRQRVRSTKGSCRVWNKKPSLILASYTNHQGKKQQSLLLTSGWWGLARHFHYIPELLGAFFWTLPALFVSPLPYFYFIFLTCLLLDRAFRHERRCAQKYGKHWEEYCERVPYKVVPYLF